MGETGIEGDLRLTAGQYKKDKEEWSKIAWLADASKSSD